jgi:hypothetical protein
MEERLCGMGCKTNRTTCRYGHRALGVDDDNKDGAELILKVGSVRFKTNVQILRNSQIPYFTAIVDGLGAETLVHDNHRRHEIEL